MNGFPGVRNYGVVDPEDMYDVYCYAEELPGACGARSPVLPFPAYPAALTTPHNPTRKYRPTSQALALKPLSSARLWTLRCLQVQGLAVLRCWLGFGGHGALPSLTPWPWGWRCPG